MWETPSVAPSNLCCALPLCQSILSISFLSLKWFKNSKFSRVRLEESRQRGTLDCKRALAIRVGLNLNFELESAHELLMNLNLNLNSTFAKSMNLNLNLNFDFSKSMNLNLNLNLVFSKSMNLNLKIKNKMNGSNQCRR